MSGKIGLIGSQGVGKTDTLYRLTSLLHKYNNTDAIIEVVKPVTQFGLPINEETTFDAQEAIQFYQKFQELVVEERIRRKEIKYGIFDRTVIDNYVYAENKSPEKSKKILYPQVVDWLERHPYYKLFKFPIWKDEITPDGTRSVNKQFQITIDNKLSILLKELEIPYEEIPKEYFLQDDEEQAISFIRYFKKYIKG
jgi:GTPase SAR1 family protein